MTGDAVHGASELKKASASMKVSMSDFPPYLQPEQTSFIQLSSRLPRLCCFFTNKHVHTSLLEIAVPLHGASSRTSHWEPRAAFVRDRLVSLLRRLRLRTDGCLEQFGEGSVHSVLDLVRMEAGWAAFPSNGSSCATFSGAALVQVSEHFRSRRNRRSPQIAFRRRSPCPTRRCSHTAQLLGNTVLYHLCCRTRKLTTFIHSVCTTS